MNQTGVRTLPKDGPHTLSGFTTGVWEGNVLTTTTTHMKTGYLRRNGVPNSDEATMTLHWMRHGDFLTVSGISTILCIYRALRPQPHLGTGYDRARDVSAETSLHAGSGSARLTGGVVPHYLPGTNPFLHEVANQYHLPEAAVMGGADTIYPEYRKKLKAGYTPPAKCTRYCCGWEDRAGFDKLHCIAGGNAASPEAQP